MMGVGVQGRLLQARRMQGFESGGGGERKKKETKGQHHRTRGGGGRKDQSVDPGRE